MIARTVSRFALLAAGIWTIQQLLHARRARRAIPARNPAAIESWEGEGGAVPVDTTRTTAAVSPAPGLGTKSTD